MFARHVSMHLKPNTRAEFTQTIENEVLPLLKKHHGFQHEIVFVAPRSRNGSGRYQSLGQKMRTRTPISEAAIQKC